MNFSVWRALTPQYHWLLVKGLSLIANYILFVFFDGNNARYNCKQRLFFSVHRSIDAMKVIGHI